MTATYGDLAIASELVDDLERVRISLENRVRSQDLFDDIAMQEQVHLVLAAEQRAIKTMTEALRELPVYPWIKATCGVGEKQAARLLGTIGDPADREMPSQLWAYCGLHVVDGRTPRHRPGVQSNWNTRAKMRAYLIATSCVKQMQSPYRVTYDAARASWAERDTSDGHKHAHGLRMVSKAVLLDLWRASRAEVGSAA